MQATQTISEGLKREFKVVVPAAELEDKLSSQLSGLKDKVRINGFRPGKVPLSHLRRLYGRSVMVDVVQNTVNEANQQIVSDNQFRLAMEPKVSLPEAREDIEAVMEAKADLAYTVALEVLPSFELADLSSVEVTREVAEVSDAELDEALTRMAKQNRSFTARDEGAAAEAGDRVTIDFVGKIDGEPFEGGTGQDIPVEIGSGSFIPGFEEQLIGAKAGDERVVKATFPDDYNAAQLAGKAAEFDVTVKAIEVPGELKIDDDLGKAFGMENLEALRNAVRDRVGVDFTAQSRRKLKRQLLDQLDKLYTFDLPPTLVQQEFDGVWQGVVGEMTRAKRSFADEGTTEEEATAEYRRISERRVRLGLVLAEIGDKADIKVNDDEITRALVERARQFPGQEKMVWEFYQKNPEALAEVRAPIFEEKVVDHLLTQAKVTDKPVSKEELFTDEEEKEGAKA
ncbi:trigger factor [Chelatococcus reniformis]|uniref:Trigger factor n=1 Tax=Chelatococcus reniformis TaxID=1494448 RepID=A0A916U0R4_9HYPH|nr:trigger factor [Chelatococcus reniformis]GGC56001.1 trigger factor [Chelatococcus reniformis]